MAFLLLSRWLSRLRLACPWRLPTKVWLAYSTLAPHTHFGQALCLHAECLWAIWSVVALSVKSSAKGSILSVLYSGKYLWSLNCGSRDIEVKALWLSADPHCYICGAGTLVFFDLDVKLEVVISIWLVMREDQLAVWHGTPLCNVITEDAKSMGFIWQTWCDVESAQSTFYRQFLSNLLTPHICGWAELLFLQNGIQTVSPKWNDLTW